MDTVVAQMNSSGSRPTLYTITKAWLCKECHKFSNTSNLIKRIVDNGRVLDVVTELHLKINIHLFRKYSLSRLHVSLGQWRSHQSCFCIWTIGDSSRRGCLGTTATVFPFLWEKRRQRRGVTLLSKIHIILLLFVQGITCFFPLLQIINGNLVCKRFLVPSILLVLPPAANGEVAIISILHMDVIDFIPKPFSMFHVYLWAFIICLW